MPRYVKLKKSTPVRWNEGTMQGYRMTVEVEEASEMPKEIFVYQRATASDGVRDSFCNIGSPADLEEYPTTAPLDDGVFFRLSSVDLVFRNSDLIEETWRLILSEVAGLVDCLNKMDDISSEEEVVIGEEPTPTPTPELSPTLLPSPEELATPTPEEP